MKVGEVFRRPYALGGRLKEYIYMRIWDNDRNKIRFIRLDGTQSSVDRPGSVWSTTINDKGAEIVKILDPELDITGE